MIRISRTSCPSVLSKSTSKGTAYRNRNVVKALWTMQHGKCCYSEMNIPEQGHGQAVEHFEPKSVFKGQKNEWKNLLLVCPQCNGKKNAKFPVMLTSRSDETKVVFVEKPSKAPAALIDPSDPNDDPEAQLTYYLDEPTSPLYGQIQARDGSVKGRVTIDVTGIDDPFFVRERMLRLCHLLTRSLYNLLVARDNNDAEQQGIHLNEYLGFMRPAAEFAGMAREFARHNRLDKLFDLAIPGLENGS